MSEMIFWLSAALLGYIFVGYPLLVAGLGRVFPLRIKTAPWSGDISIVIAGYNEASRLVAKLDSLFQSEAAAQIREVLIGSDGSTDDTASVIERYGHSRVRLISFAERRGKPAVLNDLVPQCTAEIVILTDARQAIDPPAITRLLANFCDDRVGVVSGELVFLKSDTDTTASEGVGVYWAYEKFLRKCESRFRSVPGATGAFYAIRRRLFRPLPPQCLLDDVMIPMQAIEQGSLCLLEAGAIAFDRPSQSTENESIRKRRTIAGCGQLLLLAPRWIWPGRNPIWFEFISHKILRLCSPVSLATLLVANMILRDQALYWWLLCAQAVGYGMAILGAILQTLGIRSKTFAPALLFATLNWVTVAALWDFARGRFRATWTRVG